MTTKRFDEESFYNLLDFSISLRRLGVQPPKFEVIAVHDDFSASIVSFNPKDSTPIEMSVPTPLYYEIRIKE